jgi:hypothetical protein
MKELIGGGKESQMSNSKENAGLAGPTPHQIPLLED